MSEADTAPIGHNNPPSPIETVFEVAAKRAAPLLQEATALATTALPVIAGPDDLETVAQLVKDARTMHRMVDMLRDDLKRPIDTAAKEVQAIFMPSLRALEDFGKTANRAIGLYNDKVAEAARVAAAEAARAQREEAERLLSAADNLLDSGLEAAADGIATMGMERNQQANQLDAQARGSTADLARTQTNAGTVSSKVEWTQAITDQKALRKTLGKLGDHFTLPELEKACRSFRVAEVKAGREPELKGVLFTRGSVGIVR